MPSQEAGQLNFYNNTFKIVFWLIIIVEIFSFLSHNFEIVNKSIFILIICITVFISFWKPHYGFYIAATELFISSFGYLFYFDTPDWRFSIRLGIFLAVFIPWLIKTIISRHLEFRKTTVFYPFIGFLLILIWGMVNGYLNNHALKDIFLDVNAYLYLGLLLIVPSVITSWRRLNQLMQILFAAILTISIKTAFLLFYFSHQANDELFRLVYTWIRDTRVGEIAPIYENYYRIFFQGHIWVLFALLISIILLVLSKKENLSKADSRLLWATSVLSSLTLIISFSRSLWLSLAVILFLIFIYLKFKERIPWKKILKISIIIIFVIIIDLVAITALVNVKIPGTTSAGISAGSLIKERLTDTDEVALGSRFELLKPLTQKFLDNPVLGSGFATEVSYQTLDPRTKDLNGGWYTSYAFEWGYLDIAVKVGALGLLVYLFMIWTIFKQGIETLKQTNDRRDYLIIISLLFCLLALLIVHATTPYLNHPLGIFFIIFIFGIIHFISKNQRSLNKIEKSDKIQST